MEAFGCNSRGMRDYDEEEDDAGGEEVGAHQCRECGVEKEECGVVINIPRGAVVTPRLTPAHLWAEKSGI